jgi:hypothetical protein
MAMLGLVDNTPEVLYDDLHDVTIALVQLPQLVQRQQPVTPALTNPNENACDTGTPSTAAAAAADRQPCALNYEEKGFCNNATLTIR